MTINWSVFVEVGIISFRVNVSSDIFSQNKWSVKDSVIPQRNPGTISETETKLIWARYTWSLEILWFTEIELSIYEILRILLLNSFNYLPQNTISKVYRTLARQVNSSGRENPVWHTYYTWFSAHVGFSLRSFKVTFALNMFCNWSYFWDAFLLFLRLREYSQGEEYCTHTKRPQMYLLFHLNSLRLTWGHIITRGDSPPPPSLRHNDVTMTFTAL